MDFHRVRVIFREVEVPAPDASQYPTNVSEKEQTLVGNLRLV